jgi:hypothetical protein
MPTNHRSTALGRNKLRIFANCICGKNAKEQASPFRVRIQARDLIRQQDLDFWLPGSKSDCAGTPVIFQRFLR